MAPRAARTTANKAVVRRRLLTEALLVGLGDDAGPQVRGGAVGEEAGLAGKPAEVAPQAALGAAAGGVPAEAGAEVVTGQREGRVAVDGDVGVGRAAVAASGGEDGQQHLGVL